MNSLEEIKEYDIVISKQNLTNIPLDTIGTVLQVYLDGKAFEVEFIVDGKSKVESVLRNQINKK